MPSKFPWNRSRGSKKTDQEALHVDDNNSRQRHGSIGESLEYRGRDSDHDYHGGNNFEHGDLQHVSHPPSHHTIPDRATLTPTYLNEESEIEIEDYRHRSYPFPSSSPQSETVTRRGIRDRLGLSSSRENVSEDDEKRHRDTHHHRDQFRSKFGLGRRVSIKQNLSPSSSRLDLEPDLRIPSAVPYSEQNQLGEDPTQRSYEPSPIIPQLEQTQQSQYQAYRAPVNDSTNLPDRPQVRDPANDTLYQQKQHHRPSSSNRSNQDYRAQIKAPFHYHQAGSVYDQEESQGQQSAVTPSDNQDQVQQKYDYPKSQLQREPVYKAPEYKASAEGIRRQDSIHRQSSVLRKSIHHSSSLREHRKSRSSESNTPVASSTAIGSSTLHSQPQGDNIRSNALLPSSSQTTQGLGRSNTEMQSSQDNEGPVAQAASDMSTEEVNQLIKDYQQLREKYSRVKRYYFEKDDQVKQLQNTLAHQRLSQSRTSLDDGEYTQRFTRLDGLISQLAFGFRKDWKSVPQWLQSHVNKDAITIGKQEMTAVGRAFISRWLADEVFDRYFSPVLEPNLSMELKSIQKNIRAFHPPFQTSEEREALTAKIINWRLSTVDGIQHNLSSNEATSMKQDLIARLVRSLISAIQEHMSGPPVGLEGGVHMIIELAVAILAHLPFESRDVHIEYVLPGTPLDTELMKIETGIPPLTTPVAAEASISDNTSVLSTADSASDMQPEDNSSIQESSDKVERKGFLGGLIGDRKKATNNNTAGKVNSAANSQTSLAPPGSSSGTKDNGADTNPKVRMCVFLGLEIRGKMVLAKAPVYRT